MSRGKHATGQRLRPIRLLVPLVVLVTLGTAGAVHAQQAGDEYFGCLNRGGELANVTVDGTAPSCAPNQTLIHWNEVGPPGPAGPEGPEGPEGPPVAEGFYLRSQTVSADPGALFYNIVFCDEGDLPVSGGYSVFTGNVPLPGADPGPSEIFASRYLVPSATVHGWEVQGRNASDGVQKLVVRVLCADISVPLPLIG